MRYDVFHVLLRKLLSFLQILWIKWLSAYFCFQLCYKFFRSHCFNLKCDNFAKINLLDSLFSKLYVTSPPKLLDRFQTNLVCSSVT